MRIPKRFQLLGHTIEVVIDPHVDYREDAQGEARYREDRIVLYPAGGVRTANAVGHDFCHEFVHWLFHAACEYKIRSDERIVHLVGGLLHQALSTAEYED